MAHLSEDRTKLIARVQRMQGQRAGVARRLEDGSDCGEVLQLVASIRGAVNGLTVELIEEHLRHHMVDPSVEPDPEKAKGADDLLKVLRTYLK